MRSPKDACNNDKMVTTNETTKKDNLDGFISKIISPTYRTGTLFKI